MPTEVWTGSTNISEGGIHGQTNVGHWVRDRRRGEALLDYWKLLSDDPGGKTGDDHVGGQDEEQDVPRRPSTKLNAIPDSLEAVAKRRDAGVQPAERRSTCSISISTLVGAPRQSAASRWHSASATDLKDAADDNTSTSAIVFLLLEKEDEPESEAKDPFVALNARNNVYAGVGLVPRGPALSVDAARPTRSMLQLNTHVLVHPLEVPAARSARRGPDRGHRLGELQRAPRRTTTTRTC